MTREEAVELLKSSWKPEGYDTSFEGRMVDAMVALGMLKLDEPKTPYRQMLDVARAYLDDKSAICFGKELTAKGLKIVQA